MNMIEKVARAIEDSDNWSDSKYYEAYAKAAIEAMKEPTDGMLATCGSSHSDDKDALKESYVPMIDAALNGE